MKEIPEVKDKRVLSLAILTPVHIGSRFGTLSALDFVAFNGEVHFIDQDRFGKFLHERNAIDKFVEAVGRGPIRIADFLSETLKVSLHTALPKIASTSILCGYDGLQEVKPLIRDASGAVFLPGTAIKGVFRTAVLYRLLGQPGWLEKITNLFSNGTPCSGTGYQKRKSSVFYSSKLLIRGAMQDFALPGDRGRRQDANHDLLRCLTVRDSYPSSTVQTKIIPIDFLSVSPNKSFYFSQDKKHSGKPLRVWIEAIMGGTFKLELSWDNELFAKFKAASGSRLPVNGLDDVIASVLDLNGAVLDYERKHFSGASANPAGSAARSLAKWYAGRNEQILRLGFGSGMLSTTVNLRLPENFRQLVRDNCGGHPRPGAVAPKSRRVHRLDNGAYVPLGWSAIYGPDVPIESAESEPMSQDRVPVALSREGDEDIAEVWERAKLEYFRGAGFLRITHEKGKVNVEGLQLVPPALAEHLRKGSKRVRVTATVTVKRAPRGSLRVIKIQATEK